MVILSGKNKYEQINSLDTCTYAVRDRLFLFMLSKMYCSQNDFFFLFFLIAIHTLGGSKYNTIESIAEYAGKKSLNLIICL